MTCGIYQIRNLTTGKKYVGSSKNFEKRRQDHWRALRKGKHKNPHLQNAWNMYGESDFEFVVLEECLPEERLNREQECLDTRDYEYNISQKADSPRKEKLSDEHRKKLSIAHMGHRRTKESREKQSITMVGRIVSEETRRKISATNTGKKAIAPMSEETRRKISEGNRGKHTITDEQKRKMGHARTAYFDRMRIEKEAEINELIIIRQRQKGDRARRKAERASRPRKGWHHNEETRAKIRKARIGQVMPKGRHPSEESRKKMSVAKIGNTNALGHILTKEARERLSIASTGKSPSAETRRKISESNMGRSMTEDNRLKLLEANTGKHRSEETKEKLRIANTGKKHSPESIEKMKGKVPSEETRKKLRDAMKRRLEKKGNETQFKSIS